MRRIKVRRSFEKDLKRLKKSGRFKLSELYYVVEELAKGRKLDDKFKDHKLKGEYNGYRECHIKPDVLLIYMIIDDDLILELIRIGSHSDLF